MKNTKKFTIAQLQREQSKLLNHPHPLLGYAKPWRALTEMSMGMAVLEGRCEENADTETQEGAIETKMMLIGAAVLQIADYCNAKHSDLASIMRETIDAVAERRQQETENAETENKVTRLHTN